MPDCIELKIGDWVTPDSEYGLKKLVFGKAYLVEKIGRISGNWGNYQDVVTQLSTEDGEIVDLKMAFSKFNKVLTSYNLGVQKDITIQPKAIKSDGGSSSYYDFEIPQHYLDKINETGIIKTEWLIDFMFKNDFDFACAFKALVRARGIVDGAGKEGNTLSYELNKNRYYSDKIEEKHGN